ncbi:hypothetical protein [Niabella sp.]|uniref:hypothetical protein n=1 Tax=Niabella sp. TaxID=1962976 RepID=UPI002632BA07|nr:hypothetical protein [Niabella sp.]
MQIRSSVALLISILLTAYFIVRYYIAIKNADPGPVFTAIAELITIPAILLVPAILVYVIVRISKKEYDFKLIVAGIFSIATLLLLVTMFAVM